MKNGRTSHILLLILRIRVYALLVSFSPAIFFSCTSADIISTGKEAAADLPRILSVRFADEGLPDSVDVFVFNDDALGRIESWQRLPAGKGTVDVLSGAGDKVAVVLANIPDRLVLSGGTDSYEGLSALRADLAEENPDMPFMTGKAVFPARSSGQADLSLERLGAQIIVRSLSCDFSGTEYEGEELTDVSVYLTNVSGRCPLLGTGASSPEEIVNAGHLEDDYIRGMAFPQMLYAKIDGPIGPSGTAGPVTLYCYPNESVEDTAGSPFTCLVVEGKICGRTWYWPIPVNRDSYSGKGISRNCRYIFDIRICRTGSDDPSIPVRPGDVITGFSVGDWKNSGNATVTFSFTPPSPSESVPSCKTSASGAWKTDSYAAPDEDMVHDLNLFLINDDKKLEYKAYIPNPSFWHSGGQYKWEIPLLTGCTYTLVAFANIGSQVPCSTYGELSAYRYFLSYPDDYKAGIPMVSVKRFVVEDPDEIISSVLERAMAKICVSVDRSRLYKDISMEVVRVAARSCPRSVLLLGDSRAESEDDVFPKGFIIEGEAVELLNSDLGNGMSGEICLYVLENKHGDLLPGNTSDSAKVLPDNSPESRLCTYLELQMNYSSPMWTTSDGGRLLYRYYLGDSPENFDIVRNTCSHVVIIPKGDGLSGNGWRVDKSALVPSAGSLKLSYGDLTMSFKGEKVSLTAYATPSVRAQGDFPSSSVWPLVWSSTDPSVADVSESGVVTAVGEGDCTVRCSVRGRPDVFDECEVTVRYGETFLKVSPGTYIRGRPGDIIDIRCDWYPPTAVLDIGLDELEFDRERGIYDFTPDPDGKGVTITLRNPGRGLIYMEAGEPVSDAVLVVVEVDTVLSS